ncbi:MAG TPA: hypothetical protein VHH31_04350 [Gaiellaceae bacterium]|jgi:hypothetical protein|nr:hypothetical protein [Gaiellaceae bacterium]
MSTTPPPEPPIDTGPRSYGGGGVTVDVARLPVPGNAEFALYLLALIVAWIVVWTTDSLDANDWFFFFAITTSIYILSRGIAKASRVLED